MLLQSLVRPLLVATLSGASLFAHGASSAVTPEEARAFAKEAYIYGYPLVDSYRIQYAYYVDKDDKSYKAPWVPGVVDAGRPRE